MIDTWCTLCSEPVENGLCVAYLGENRRVHRECFKESGFLKDVGIEVIEEHEAESGITRDPGYFNCEWV